MAKPKGPTFAQAAEDFRAGAHGPNAVEARPYTVLAVHSRESGRTEVDIRCPFCRSTVTARKWSLAGGGKRCVCGALFGSTGSAYHWAAS